MAESVVQNAIVGLEGQRMKNDNSKTEDDNTKT